MKKREIMAWVIAFLCFSGFYLAFWDFPIKLKTENIEIEGDPLFNVKLSSKSMAMLQPPIPIDPATQNVSIGDLEMDLSAEIPPGVDINLVRSESRHLLGYVNSLTINCNYIIPESLNITIGAHVATDNGGIQQLNFTTYSRSAAMLWTELEITEISNVQWELVYTEKLSINVDLRLVLWKLGGDYPIIVRFFILVEGLMIETYEHFYTFIETQNYRIDAP